MGETVALIVVEFIILAIVCIYLIRYYKGHSVTLDVSIVVYISWVTGLVGIILLPYDMSIALVLNIQSEHLTKIWLVTYWR